MTAPPESDDERIFAAQLLLAVGQVEAAERMLSNMVARPLTPTLSPDGGEGVRRVTERRAQLAESLRLLIATVKGRATDRLNPALSPNRGEGESTFALARSYYFQSAGLLEAALVDARKATQIA